MARFFYCTANRKNGFDISSHANFMANSNSKLLLKLISATWKVPHQTRTDLIDLLLDGPIRPLTCQRGTGTMKSQYCTHFIKGTSGGNKKRGKLCKSLYTRGKCRKTFGNRHRGTRTRGLELSI